MPVHVFKDPYDIYIGRGPDPHTRERGRWGNPYSNMEGPGTVRVNSREDAILYYRRWLWEQIEKQGISLEDLAALHGKTLGCWCAPKSCHGEVLERAAAWAAKKLEQ